MDGLYDSDILRWSEQQAALLRRLAAGERVNDAIDWPNLIDEVESVGRSQLNAVESLLDVGLRHLVLAYAAARREAVPHWRAEARAALARAGRLATPGMLPRLELPEIWASARDVALAKLAVEAGIAREVSEACPFTLAELLDRQPEIDTLLAHLDA
ncbi:DUF29 domain-containing protein [Siccirubricoccus phaeus]|uniref:DUF29 domain-containing protein n=1 Tax=Siccirubricoccus phaeus TaxID=2595053 RepID=UPI0011F1DAD0|nr:DUF29 domain-containing protein [Siccirubricoccus phaeus]